MRKASKTIKEYRLSDVIQLVSGGTPRTSCPEYWGGDIPWIAAADLSKENRFIESTQRSITKLGLKHSSTNLLQSGDCIIAARGTIGVVNQVKSPMAFNQTCYGIRARGDLLDSDYMYYLLCHYSSQFESISHGGVFQTITRSMFDEIIVLLPAIDKQRKIAKCIWAWDKAIANISRTIEVKLSLRSYCLQQLMRGLIRFPHFGEHVTDCISKPKEWIQARLCDICSIKYGESWKSVKSVDGYPVYGTGGLIGYASRPLSEGPAIIIGRKGTIDKPFLVDHPFWCVDTTFYAQTTEDHNILFLIYKLSILNWGKHNEASGLPSLSRNAILGITLSMPAIEEQKVIAGFLRTLDNELDTLVGQKRLFGQMKQGIMKLTINGKVKAQSTIGRKKRR